MVIFKTTRILKSLNSLFPYVWGYITRIHLNNTLAIIAKNKRNVFNPQKGAMFLCTKCGKKFASKNDLNGHEKFVHVEKKLLICEDCGKRYVSVAALNSHKIVHSEKKPFKCTKCLKSFKRRVTLKIHEKSHASHKVICPICSKPISSPALLSRHMVFHSEHKKYKCNFCGKLFRRSDAFKHHLILHSRLKPYQCVFCDLTFADGSNCRKHQKVAHSLELAAAEVMGIVRVSKNVPKIEQLRAVNDEILLKPHKETFLMKEKQFFCDICSKETTSSRSLEVHKLIHIKATLQCDMCPRLFKNVEKLNIHKKSCNVQCLICNVKLKNNHSLKEHVLLHTDIKNFKCTLCEYVTKHQRNLKAHMLTHTGLKPYRCLYCEASYAHQSNCKKHVKHSHKAEFINSVAERLQPYTKHVPSFKELKKIIEQMKKSATTKTITENEENIKGYNSEATEDSISNIKNTVETNEDVEIKNLNEENNCNLKMILNKDDKIQENAEKNENFNEVVIRENFVQQFDYYSKDKNLLKIEEFKMSTAFACNKKDIDLKRENDHKHSSTFDLKEAVAKCEICNKTFLSKGAWASHLKTKHSIVSKPKACKFCGKAFKAISALEKHELTHLPPEKRETFSCTQCDKNFFWEKHLKIHIEIVHIGKTSFICEECGKGYLTFNALSAHKIVHSNKKPFKCTKCEKSFKRIPALQEHLRNNHTERKNFKCILCQYACKDRRNFKTHMLIHAKLKPYHCQFCEASYSDLSNCKKHEKHAHPVEYAEMKLKNQPRTPNQNIPKFCKLKEILSQMELQTS